MLACRILLQEEKPKCVVYEATLAYSCCSVLRGLAMKAGADVDAENITQGMCNSSSPLFGCGDEACALLIGILFQD